MLNIGRAPLRRIPEWPGRLCVPFLQSHRVQSQLRNARRVAFAFARDLEDARSDDLQHHLGLSTVVHVLSRDIESITHDPGRLLRHA